MVYRGPRDEYKVFSQRLQKALDATGMSQSQLAHKLNMSKSMVSNYLSSRSMPEGVRLRNIAKTLNVESAWLFGADVNSDGSAISKTGIKSDDYIDISQLSPEDKKYIRRMVELAKIMKG